MMQEQFLYTCNNYLFFFIGHNFCVNINVNKGCRITEVEEELVPISIFSHTHDDADDDGKMVIVYQSGRPK